MTQKHIVRVKDVMKTDLQLVDGMDTVADVLSALIDDGPTCLVVRKRNDDDEYGIVTLNDIARQVLAVDKAPDRVNIYEIMTKPAITVDHEMDIRYCARLFAHSRLSLAPVLENREIVGVVSYGDMVIKGLRANGA